MTAQTTAQRVRAHRDRRIAAGWRVITALISPAAVAELDRLAGTAGSRQAAIERWLVSKASSTPE